MPPTQSSRNARQLTLEEILRMNRHLAKGRLRRRPPLDATGGARVVIYIPTRYKRT